MRAAGDQIVCDTLWRGLQTVIGHTVHCVEKAVRQALHNGLGNPGFVLDHIANARQFEARQRCALCGLGIVSVTITPENQALVESIARSANADIGFAAILVEAVNTHKTVEHTVKMLCRVIFTEKNMPCVESYNGRRFQKFQRRFIIPSSYEWSADKDVPVLVAQFHSFVHVRHGSRSNPDLTDDTMNAAVRFTAPVPAHHADGALTVCSSLANIKLANFGQNIMTAELLFDFDQ